jgi:hypothetical protein
MKKLCTLFLAAFLFAAADAPAQESRPYKDGPVTHASFIRTKPGQFDNYMKYLSGSYRANAEAGVKAGLIVSYKIFTLSPRTPQDPDVILTITYPNYAALDKSDEFDALATRIYGSFATQDKAFADRGAMREVLGSQFMRELILK